MVICLCQPYLGPVPPPVMAPKCRSWQPAQIHLGRVGLAFGVAGEISRTRADVNQVFAERSGL
jgi:hypothetical protein